MEAIDASKPFLPIFLREIADGAVHLGSEELALLAGVFGTVRSVIAEGAPSRKCFSRFTPALAHFTIIAPVIMFRATAPVRARIEATRGVVIPDADPSTVVKHLQMVARRMLAPQCKDRHVRHIHDTDRAGCCCLTALVARRVGTRPRSGNPRVSGQVEATEVQVSPEVGGRILEVPVAEGDRVKQGDLIARLDTRDVELALQRAQADRAAADAQFRLVQAGSRPEDIRQADAQTAAAGGDVAAVQTELASAEADLQRFDKLFQSHSGSQKQRDDAATRRDMARDRLASARARENAAREGAARLKAGARREEIDAARARVASADAQIAALEKNKADATVVAPIAGVVSERLLDPGEVVAPRAPMVVLTDLDNAWAEVFVDEPQVPRLKIGQPATVFTDAGGSIPGKISFISSKAEFTPRNVQTAEDRSKLVYRVKIAVDNRQGVLKQGMPVEAEIPLQ